MIGNGLKKNISRTGYNNHNYDDFVLSHNLLEAGVDVEELKMMSGDVAKVVRPMLATRRWKLGVAMEELLGRRQVKAHRALSDATDAKELMEEVAKRKGSTVRNILENTKGKEIEEQRAFKQFEDVWSVCVKMKV